MDSELPPDANPAPPTYAAPPPPLSRPPPIITPASPPRPPKKGTGWKILAIILLVLLGLSFLSNLRHAAMSVAGVKMKTNRGNGPRLEEVTVRDDNASDKIVVVPIQGIISGESTDGSGYSMVSVIKEQLKLAGEDGDVKAVILKVDSPGGEVLAADEIAAAVRKCEAGQDGKPGKPVVVSMGSLAASGGYYVSVPSRWIVANELTITGSIGVIMEGLNYRGLLDKIGVRPEVFKSGKYKDMMSPVKSSEEITPEERQMVQDLIDETFAKFKQVVQDGREAAFKNTPHTDPGVSHALSDNWADFADGRILSGTQALQLGFVDELGDFDVAVGRARGLAGISKANLVEYQPVFDISNLFRLLGKSDVKTIKIDTGVDLPNLRAGCEYFLSTSYLP